MLLLVLVKALNTKQAIQLLPTFRLVITVFEMSKQPAIRVHFEVKAAEVC